MKIPDYLKDIDVNASGMPYGQLVVEITRHYSRTSKLVTYKFTKIEPKTNADGLKDVEKLLNLLISGNFSGTVQFDVVYKSGTIKMLNIKNTETKNYGPK